LAAGSRCRGSAHSRSHDQDRQGQVEQQDTDIQPAASPRQAPRVALRGRRGHRYRRHRGTSFIYSVRPQPQAVDHRRLEPEQQGDGLPQRLLVRLGCHHDHGRRQNRRSCTAFSCRRGSPPVRRRRSRRLEQVGRGAGRGAIHRASFFGLVGPPGADEISTRIAKPSWRRRVEASRPSMPPGAGRGDQRPALGTYFFQCRPRRRRAWRGWRAMAGQRGGPRWVAGPPPTARTTSSAGGAPPAEAAPAEPFPPPSTTSGRTPRSPRPAACRSAGPARARTGSAPRSRTAQLRMYSRPYR